MWSWKELYLVLTTEGSTTVKAHFFASRPSTVEHSVTPLLRTSLPSHLLGGVLKVSESMASQAEYTIENVQVHLRRLNTREVHLSASNEQYKIVAKSRFYPWADRNQRRKRLDLAFSVLMDEGADVVAPHGLIGQTFDRDGVAIDGALDDYTGGLIDGYNRLVITHAMGEGAIEGVASDYEVNRTNPFSTSFKYARFGLTKAEPRNITSLTGKKRRVIRMKGIPVASMEHDVSDAVQL
jgi:hypothetical protein